MPGTFTSQLCQAEKSITAEHIAEMGRRTHCQKTGNVNKEHVLGKGSHEDLSA
jgi:hypothetical protein